MGAIELVELLLALVSLQEKISAGMKTAQEISAIQEAGGRVTDELIAKAKALRDAARAAAHGIP